MYVLPEKILKQQSIRIEFINNAEIIILVKRTLTNDNINYIMVLPIGRTIIFFDSSKNCLNK